ncbi:hypothetical protein LZP81_31080 [Streptomyces parvulus]|uniref:hypothetical protein n=1 Tax=Streptomyces parvulus TaxID=146923 RepID=UPI001E558480|nr:hypothetical protein [Streptomyces parvulus]MCC9154852.1 hypothetical protein [Streptomyces parvulus]MCE7691303.1 hypothetical protein [Streptomyces parvulus]
MTAGLRNFSGHPRQLMVGTCPKDGKACFLSRQDARRAARGMFPGQHHRAFKCGDRWHFQRLGRDAR